jgi:hypothetical protein
MSADFKPTAPPQGRDWLTNGFGIPRCMCVRCASPKREETAVAVPTALPIAIAPEIAKAIAPDKQLPIEPVLEGAGHD